MNEFLDSSGNRKTTEHADRDGDNEECLIVDVKMPPPDLVQKAAQYQLPKSFFNYITKPDCPGCIGCKSDEFEFTYAQPGESSCESVNCDSLLSVINNIVLSILLNECIHSINLL